MARKQLNADVRAFLKGDKSSNAAETTSEVDDTQGEKNVSATPSTPRESTDGLLADILGPDQQNEAIVRYTADLPESLHQRLSYAAVKNKTTKIRLLRQVLDKVLPQLPT